MTTPKREHVRIVECCQGRAWWLEVEVSGVTEKRGKEAMRFSCWGDAWKRVDKILGEGQRINSRSHEPEWPIVRRVSEEYVA